MALDLSSFFSAGVEEFGEVAQAKDVAVSAEAKASAEEFVEKNEKYENEVETNRNKLKQSAKAITSNLGINDVGKIRTIISAYGNEDTIKELQKDFATYQMKTIAKENDGKFKTLSEYVKGKISGSGNTFLSDEAAEQAEDEVALIGDELDIQKAEKRAKAQGVTLEEYLNNEARAMSNRPAFNTEARAARLVEESKMGIFGKTLTMEEARQQVTGGRSMGEKAKDLGDTGYAIEREGGLSPEQKIKLKALQDKVDPKLDPSALLTLENKYINQLSDPKFTITKTGTDGVSRLVISDAPEARAAMLDIINKEITSETFKKMSPLGQKQLLALKEKYERSSAKKEDKTSKVNIQKRDEKIKNYKKQGMSNQDIANGLVQSAKNKGQELSIEEALKIVQGIK